jgi:hypothetical protein
VFDNQYIVGWLAFLLFWFFPEVTFYVVFGSLTTLITILLLYNMYRDGPVGLWDFLHAVEIRYRTYGWGFQKYIFMDAGFLVWACICRVFIERPIFSWGLGSLIWYFFCQALHMLLEDYLFHCHHIDPCDCYRDYYRDGQRIFRPKSERHLTDQCHHVDLGCTCFNELASEIDRIQTEASEYRDNYEMSITDHRRLRFEGDPLPQGPARSSHIPGFDNVYEDNRNLLEQVRKLQELLTVEDSRFTQQPALEHAQTEIAAFQQENARLRTFITAEQARYEKKIDSLQAQVNYASGASNERLELLANIAELRKKEVEHDAQIKLGKEELLLAKSELAFEQQKMISPCEDSNFCVKQREGLMIHVKELQDELKDHDTMVQEAVQKLGLNEYGVHISLRQYIFQSVVHVLSQQHSAASPLSLLGESSPTEDLLKTLQLENKRNFMYIGRLEQECTRLGANLRTIQSGTRTDVSAPFRLYKWDEYQMLVFSIYEKLHTKIAQFEGMIQLWDVSAPRWEMEVARTSEGNEFAKVLNQFHDKLSYKLVEAEIQRLFVRLNSLLAFTSNHVKTNIVADALEKAYNDAATEAKPVVNEVLALLEGFWEVDLYRMPPRGSNGDSVTDRRFTIYSAMQDCIFAMQKIILAYNTTIPFPQWLPNFPPRTYNRRPTWQLLAQTLQKHEIDTLHARIEQLLEHMNNLLNMPGTPAGDVVHKAYSGDEAFKKYQESIKNVWDEGAGWSLYWRQRPLPGGREAMNRIHGVDGWLWPPNAVIQKVSLVQPRFHDDGTVKKTYDWRDGSNNNNNTFINNNTHKNNDKMDMDPEFEKRTKINKDNTRPEFEKLTKINKDNKDRVEQLAALASKNHWKFKDWKFQNDGKFFDVFKPKIMGNFTQTKGHGQGHDLEKLKNENLRMNEMIREYDSMFKQAAIPVPKWPKNMR